MIHGIGKKKILMVMKNSRPKILFFVTEDWFVCSHWLPIIKGAIDSGYEVVVVTRINKDAEMFPQHGIKIIPFDIFRRGSNIFRELAVIIRLLRIYLEEQPDIVHHVAIKPMLYGSFVSFLARVPHAVNWVSGMGWLFVSKKRRAKMMQFSVRKILALVLRGTSVIVENKDDQKIISGMGVSEDKISLIRGAGVDASLYVISPETDALPQVVLPARMLWDKGVGEFVEAARRLKNSGIKAKFILVGEPDTENPASVLLSQLVAWQEEGVVEWWGRREDMPRVLAQCHVVCLPSYREGLPKSLLEAASCGRPIVTTNVPGCRDVVMDGGNGLLVEARDVNSLADALQKLIVNPKLRIELGKCGRERVLNEFSQEIIVAQVLQHYSKVLS